MGKRLRNVEAEKERRKIIEISLFNNKICTFAKNYTLYMKTCSIHFALAYYIVRFLENDESAHIYKLDAM